MKKLFSWIWSSKQNEEVETFVIHNRPIWDVQMREYNLTHGLPEDQVIGWRHEATKKLFSKKPKQPEPFFEWVETPEEKSERLKNKYIK